MMIKSIESQDCLPEHLVRESEDHEESMRRTACKLAEVEKLDEPLEILNKLLGRSLKHYTMKELMEMLVGPNEELSSAELEHLFYLVCPEATFSGETLAQLAIEFSSVSADGSKKPSRQKVTEYCRATLEEYMAPHHVDDSPESVPSFINVKHKRSTGSDAAQYLSTSGGDELLTAYIAQMEEAHADQTLNRWAVMYCGGSPIIADALTQVCSDFDIKYNQEKFDW